MTHLNTFEAHKQKKCLFSHFSQNGEVWIDAEVGKIYTVYSMGGGAAGGDDHKVLAKLTKLDLANGIATLIGFDLLHNNEPTGEFEYYLTETNFEFKNATEDQIIQYNKLEKEDRFDL